MKTLLSLVLVACTAVLGTARAATAKPVQPMTMTCAEFLEVGETYQPALVYWIASVDRLGVRETDTIEVDDPQVQGYFVEACRKSPRDKLAAKVKQAVQDNVLKINYNGA